MSRHVAKLSVCFQGFPNLAGGSTRHGRKMVLRVLSLLQESIEHTVSGT
jgi:hypothetical protein